jgi:hypothetical protein
MNEIMNHSCLLVGGSISLKLNEISRKQGKEGDYYF